MSRKTGIDVSTGHARDVRIEVLILTPGFFVLPIARRPSVLARELFKRARREICHGARSFNKEIKRSRNFAGVKRRKKIQKSVHARVYARAPFEYNNSRAMCDTRASTSCGRGLRNALWLVSRLCVRVHTCVHADGLHAMREKHAMRVTMVHV